MMRQPSGRGPIYPLGWRILSGHRGARRGATGRGWAGHVGAWQDKAPHGPARRVRAARGVTRPGAAGPGRAGLGLPWHPWAWRALPRLPSGKARYGWAGSGLARRGFPARGSAWRDMAGQGESRQGATGHCSPWLGWLDRAGRGTTWLGRARQ